MTVVFIIIQMVLAALLVVLVLLQQKGAGLGAAFGGSSNIYSTKRGIDKVVFRLTIAVAILFFGISIIVTAI